MTLNSFRNSWQTTLMSLYLKLQRIQDFPRSFTIYCQACLEFLRLYPDAPTWDAADLQEVDSPAKKWEADFRNIFLNLSNETRTSQYHQRLAGLGREAYENPIVAWLASNKTRPWEILTLPEFILLRDLYQTHGIWSVSEKNSKHLKKKDASNWNTG